MVRNCNVKLVSETFPQKSGKFASIFWRLYKCSFAESLTEKTVGNFFFSVKIYMFSLGLPVVFCVGQCGVPVETEREAMLDSAFGGKHFSLWQVIAKNVRKIYFLANCSIDSGRQILAQNHLRLQWNVQQVLFSSVVCFLIFASQLESN